MPAASVDLAESWVVASEGTVTGMPAPANSATDPPLAGEPEQEAFVNTSTVAASPPAVPLTSGWLSLAGESGSVSVIWGAGGGVASL